MQALKAKLSLLLDSTDIRRQHQMASNSFQMPTLNVCEFLTVDGNQPFADWYWTADHTLSKV